MVNVLRKLLSFFKKEPKVVCDESRLLNNERALKMKYYRRNVKALDFLRVKKKLKESEVKELKAILYGTR